MTALRFGSTTKLAILGVVALILLVQTCTGLQPLSSTTKANIIGGNLRSSTSIHSSSTITSSRSIRSGTTRLDGMLDPRSFETDDEWHPRDPAFTTPQLLAGIWHQIAQAGNMVNGETMTVIYPQMEEEINKPKYLQSLFSHLDLCKDVCDHFGITTTLVPFRKGSKIVGFTSKSFKTKNQIAQGVDEETGEYDFAYDPFWDDGTDFETLYKDIDDEYENFQKQKQKAIGKAASIVIENKIPDDDDVIIDITKSWVQTMMSNMGICPFTQDAERAGLPLGDVFYCVDRSSTVEDVYSVYWNEVIRIEQNKEKDVSTSLLILPEFYMDNVELFESFSTTLTNALTVLDVEELLQLVFFHPDWSFRDGSARTMGDDAAANYARRSPWPMINLLRTKQVLAAQKGIPTGLVYKQNEKTLAAVGTEKLETMLRLRDWADVADIKVNRREFDALKIAQDFQATGTVDKQYMSLEHDATPAANKIDRKQVEQGDLVRVLMQALEKRLGKNEGQTIQRLTGPETSASAMAVDFLMQELDTYLSDKADATTSTLPEASKVEKKEPSFFASVKAKAHTEASKPSSDPPAPDRMNLRDREALEKAGQIEPETLMNRQDKEERDRAARMEAARKALLDDLMGNEDDQESPSYGDRKTGDDKLWDVLSGKQSIPENKDDENLPKGLEPFDF